MNPEGRIVQVLARASGLFVGTYFEDGGAGFVKVDGTTFHDPIYVGDPGAKGAKPGDKVALEMVRYPTPYLEGEGVITEILGPRGQPGVDTLSIIRAFNIPDTFDDDDARRGPRPGQAVLRGRDRRPARPPRRADRHDRPGHRARLRRRDHPVPRRARLLEPRGPHRRRLALRPRRLGARPTRPGSAGRASTCPTASSRCSRRSSRTAWRASRRADVRYTVSALHGVQRRGHPDRPPLRPVGDPGRPPLHLRAGVRGHEGPRRRPPRASRPRSPRCSARCSSWR